MTPPAGAPPPAASGATCADRTATGSRPRVWLLTADQYARTVATLFSGRSSNANRDLTPVKGLPAPFGFVNESDRYSTQASSYNLREDELQDALAAADFVAGTLYDALATKSCLSEGGAAAAGSYKGCMEDLVRERGALLFRRPLTGEEVTRYAALATGAVATVGKRAATELALKALLMAPQFLFRVETGQPVAGDAQRRRLTAHEIAAALSYGITDGPPDRALWDAAASGALTDPATIAREAVRLVGATADTAPLQRFVREFLHYAEAADLDKANAKNHRPADLVKETDLSVAALLAQAGRKDFIKTFLTARTGFASANTAAVYGVMATGTSPAPVTFTDPDRVGFLAQPSWLVAHSQPERNDVVKRGRFVREYLLCQHVPEVDILEVAPIPADPQRTLRDKMIAHVESPSCQACHSLLDPIGFAFEGFDHFGKGRTTEAGKPVDRSGKLIGSDQDGPVDGVKDLMDRLSRSRMVTECVVSQAFQSFMGRAVSDADACAIAQGTAAYEASGGDLAATVGALYASDVFLTRKP
jgi:hypothetical protein